jgi:transposase
MTPEAVKPAPKTEAKKPSSKKPAAKELNKSAEIRKVATAMKAKGEKPRPVVIIEMLEKQGVTVSSPQVSMVLKKMGFRPRRRRKGPPNEAKARGSATKKTVKVKVEDLVKAKRIATQMGGVDKALAFLNALKDFEG